MNSEINSIWTDWRLQVPSGVPNPFNDYHLALLKEICFNHNVNQGIVDDVILFLEKSEGGLDPKEKEKAKKLGLVSKGYGNWGKDKDGPTTHKTKDGKLVPVGDEGEPEKEEPKASGMSTDDYASTALTSKPDVEKTESAAMQIMTFAYLVAQIEQKKGKKGVDELFEDFFYFAQKKGGVFGSEFGPFSKIS